MLNLFTNKSSGNNSNDEGKGGDWFQNLFGFRERDQKDILSNFTIKDGFLKSEINGRSYKMGELEVLTLKELRERVMDLNLEKGKLKVSEIVSDVQSLHTETCNENAVFQVASQFNLLEMIGPSVSPEVGITGYENDPTQGPACAIACGAGTFYRNYLHEVHGRRGQTRESQVDCSEDIGSLLGNNTGSLWSMTNGYLLPTVHGIGEINKLISSYSDSELDDLRSMLKIGIHWDTQVTLNGCMHNVTQAFCSALPVTYSSLEPSKMKIFSKLILDSSYECLFASAVLNYQKNGSRKLFLTKLGGGAFGNNDEWIRSAIERSLRLYKDYPLEVSLVSYGYYSNFLDGFEY
jgi:hypothetical protein